jgi:hypothetical protein
VVNEHVQGGSMTLEMKRALDVTEKRLEEFFREAGAGSIEIHVVNGKPIKVRVIKDESLKMSG